ncbi:MAG: hypothetical protein AB8G05_00675 [Oligoflexales bacterium]
MKHLFNIFALLVFQLSLEKTSSANESYSEPKISEVEAMIDELPSFQNTAGNFLSVPKSKGTNLENLRLNALKDFDLLVEKSNFQLSKKDQFKDQLENFYLIASDLLDSSAELSQDLFNEISELQDTISGELLSNRGDYFCDLNSLESCKNSIVKNLEIVMKKVTDRLLSDGK